MYVPKRIDLMFPIPKSQCVLRFWPFFPTTLDIELRRYVLAPTDELKEKFKDYGLTTLGVAKEKKEKDGERERSRSPLRCDRKLAVPTPGHSASRILRCYC